LKRPLAQAGRHVSGPSRGDGADRCLERSLVRDQGRLDKHIHTVVEQHDGKSVRFSELVNQTPERELDRIQLAA